MRRAARPRQFLTLFRGSQLWPEAGLTKTPALILRARRQSSWQPRDSHRWAGSGFRLCVYPRSGPHTTGVACARLFNQLEERWPNAKYIATQQIVRSWWSIEHWSSVPFKLAHDPSQPVAARSNPNDEAHSGRSASSGCGLDRTAHSEYTIAGDGISNAYKCLGA